jgi:hypothetical protein
MDERGSRLSSWSSLTEGWKLKSKWPSVFHGQESGGAHCGLEPALIAERDLAAQELRHRHAGRDLDGVGAAKNLIERFQLAGAS